MRVLTADGSWQDVHSAELGYPSSGSPDSFRRTSDLGVGPWAVTDFQLVYETNPWAWACVQAIAKGLSRLPIKVYDDTTEIRKRVHPGRTGALPRLAYSLQRPADDVSRKSLVLATVVDKLVHGNALWSVDVTADGFYEFGRLPWKEIDPRRDRRTRKRRYLPRGTGGATILGASGVDRAYSGDEVIHFGLGAGGDDFCGTSPFKSLRATLQLHHEVVLHLISYFRRGARPSGHLQTSSELDEEVKKLIRAEVEKLYTGSENAGRVLITSGEWTDLTHTPDHSKVVELAHESREEICAALRVPPPVAGILDRAIKSNVSELRTQYIRDAVGPEAELLEADFMTQLVYRDPVLSPRALVEWDFNGQLRPDLVERAKAMKDLVYIYAVDELRPLENLEPIGEAPYDKPWPPPTTAPSDAGGDGPTTEENDDDDDEE